MGLFYLSSTLFSRLFYGEYVKLSMLFLRYFVFCKSCCNIVLYRAFILR